MRHALQQKYAPQEHQQPIDSSAVSNFTFDEGASSGRESNVKFTALACRKGAPEPTDFRPIMAAMSEKRGANDAATRSPQVQFPFVNGRVILRKRALAAPKKNKGGNRDASDAAA
ncbi:hypothetical protein JDN40_02210 [Rhodomicrobium vannielii ATCC 17100]|uniref:hypothetical protein n=1 Tax=Rhodomicrobium vannielii TaxID=1069 RepID=UPI001918F306|nr:hypothetical protein [Rhodomicrobium vannielii]MBJ7532928.1 hypothetical protein [Rhodomicrobium vannielii ATCC 17100]